MALLWAVSEQTLTPKKPFGVLTPNGLNSSIFCWVTSDSFWHYMIQSNTRISKRKKHTTQKSPEFVCMCVKWAWMWIWTRDHNGLIKIHKVLAIIILSRATGMVLNLPKWNRMQNINICQPASPITKWSGLHYVIQQRSHCTVYVYSPICFEQSFCLNTTVGLHCIIWICTTCPTGIWIGNLWQKNHDMPTCCLSNLLSPSQCF